MRFLYWLTALSVLVFVFIFAIFNRQHVSINLWPAPITIEPRLIVLTMFVLFVGFVFGGMVAWARGGATRARARDLERQIDADRRELDMLRKNAALRAAVPPSATDRGPSPAITAPSDATAA